MSRNTFDAAHICADGKPVSWTAIIGDPIRCPRCDLAIIGEPITIMDEANLYKAIRNSPNPSKSGPRKESL